MTWAKGAIVRRKSDGAHAEVIDAENSIVRFGVAASGPLGERKVAPVDPDDFEFVGMRHGDVDYTKPRTVEEVLRGSRISDAVAAWRKARHEALPQSERVVFNGNLTLGREPYYHEAPFSNRDIPPMIPRNLGELEELRAENKRLRALYEELLRSRSIGTKIAFSMVDDAQKRLHDAKQRFRKTRRVR